MSSKSETGVAVNAINLSKIRARCEDKGAKFNPPDTAISVANIKLKETAVNGSILTLQEKSAPWMIAVNGRSDAMALVNPLMTKIKNMALVCDVSDSFKADVSSMVKNIQGVRATPIVVTEPGDPQTPTDETIVHISASQQGFDNKLQNVSMLHQLLSAEPKYLPNETDLTLVSLAAVIADLTAKNTDVIDKTPPVESARIARNVEIFGAGGGNEIAAKVKKYFKAVWGGNSPEYHDVAKFKFTGGN